MLRRLMPFIIVVLAMLWDTAIFPVFYFGIFTIPLTLAVVVCTSLQKGRMMGMLIGMIGGLLIDISSGTLGLMTFVCIAVGFMTDFILNELHRSISSDLSREKKMTNRKMYLRRALWISIQYFTVEIFMLVIQYFNTAVLEWVYLRNICLRTCVFTAITMLIYSPIRRLYFGAPGIVSKRNIRNKAREERKY